jgi:hypothetical protein
MYTLIFLSDEKLQAMRDRGELEADVLMPRMVFAALCLQALKAVEHDPARLLVSRIRIKELLDDPHNQDRAALSLDTLDKLCRQAKSRRAT